MEGRIISASSNGWNSPKSTMDSILAFPERNLRNGAPKFARTQLPDVMNANWPPGRSTF